MGQGLELIVGRATAPGAVFTVLTMNTGNSAVVRGTDTGKDVRLVAAWAFNQVAGTFRIRSARLHDILQGMRWRVTAASVLPLYQGPGDRAFAQKLIPQDNLTLDITGSGVGGQIEEAAMLIYYQDLTGIQARLIGVDDVRKFGVNVLTQEVTNVAVASGDYGGQVAINTLAGGDTLKANTDYAILGGMTDTRGTAVRIQGVDLGNLGCGFPAEPSIRDVTNEWFCRLAEQFQLPLIPVINSANKTAVLIDVATNQAGGTYINTLNLVELQPGSVAGAPPVR
jgi:hypothetical protein